MGLEEITTAAYNIVTSSAVIVGGIWAYFKFVRGRTFANRAELNVSISFERADARLHLSAIFTLKNTGQSRIPLNSKMKAARLFGMVDSQESDGPAETRWERIKTTPIFEQHEWLEAYETVTDTVVYRLPAPGSHHIWHTAYQVEAIVGARRRLLTRKGVQWQARAVAFIPLASSENRKLLQRVARLRKELNHE